jgi:hypothetical protein
MRAVELLEYSDNPRDGIKVVGVDISNHDYLLMHIYTPNGIKEVPIIWDDMDKGIAESKDNLSSKLGLLKQTVKNDRGKHNRYDATYPGRIHAR